MGRAEDRSWEGVRHAFFEVAGDAVMILDAGDGTILDVNDRACEMYGLDRSGLVGNRLSELVTMVDARGPSLVERARAAGRATAESHRERADGSVMHVEHQAVRVDDAERRALVTIDRDVTGRKQTEGALREREFQLRVLSELTSDCCWARWEYPDGRSRREWVTGSFSRLTGYTPEEFEEIGREELVHPDDLNGALQRVTGPAGISEHEFRVVTKSGEVRWLHERMHVMEDQDGTMRVFGATRDITQRKRAEQLLLESRERLHQSQRLESLGQLAGGVAHDFNNLLMVILGYSERILESCDEEDAPARYATEIQRAANRAATLTRQLLAYGRKQPLQPRVVEVNQAILEMARMLDRLLPVTIETTLGLSPDLPPVRVDPGQLEQVIVNLVVNARDAMPDGGRIRIDTREILVGERDAARFPSASPGRYVALAVVDDGHGMSAETRSRVFEPFFTTKRVGAGTGLGLAAVYGSITQSGGFVTVESAPGEGARFEVFLPASSEAVGRKTEPSGEAVPTGGETILVAEDESVVRNLVSESLRNLGYKVLEAASPTEALRRADGRDGEIHLLLTDVVMPEMDGWTLAREILAVRPEMRVIFMSGHPRDTAGTGENPVPGAAYLEKPFSPDRLGRTVREILDRP